MLFQKLMGKGPTSMISPSAPKTLWTWGRNNYGQLGLGDVIHRSSPVQVGALATWSQIAGGSSHSVATKTDGTLWIWGQNHYGQLGLGNQGETYNTSRSSPVQVGALATWSQIAGGSSHSVATKTDGTLWAWGQNALGRLGLGDVISRSSPVQVGALATWSRIAGGSSHSVATKTDGTLWSWGGNSTGYLGLGDTVYRSLPVQVGTLATWSAISAGSQFSLTLKTDGTLWAWGRNELCGQLGLGDIARRSSPTQVGTLATWSQLAVGRYHSLALKTDGTLWGWGQNKYGQLGLGDASTGYPSYIKKYRSSPVQVGTLSTWSQIAGGHHHSVAIKTDGTLWSWGRHDFGQLGLGDIINRSSPVQVGTLATWTVIAKGSDAYHSIALHV